MMKEFDLILKKADKLLGSTLDKITQKAKENEKQKLSWQKHRLILLLNSVKEAMAIYPEQPAYPQRITELTTTLNLIEKWRPKQNWKDFERGFIDPKSYKHNIIQLFISEYLEFNNHEVTFIERRDYPTPDLYINTLNQNTGKVLIEVYQPEILDGRPIHKSSDDIKKIIRKGIKKVKKQIGDELPCFIVIGTFEQDPELVISLKEKFLNYLDNENIENFIGFIFCNFGYKILDTDQKKAVKNFIQIEFTLNSSYYGDVNFIDGSPNPFYRVKKNIVLDKIDIQKLKIKTIFTWQSELKEPLFVGYGDTDFLCYNCKSVIAFAAWEKSINSIIVECPNCHKKNYFKNNDLYNIKIVELLPGQFNLSSYINLHRNVSLRGKNIAGAI